MFFSLIVIPLTQTGLACGFLAVSLVQGSADRATGGKKRIAKNQCPAAAMVPLTLMLFLGTGELVRVNVSKKLTTFA